MTEPTSFARRAAPLATAALLFAAPARAAEPAPVEPAPVEPAPVEPAPVEPAPAEPAPDPGPDTVLVKGNRAEALKRASGSGAVVTKKEIQRAQPESPGEMLRRVPGLQVRQEDPTGLRLNLGVRGLSPTRSRLVLVQEDGVPVVVSPYGEPELYYMTALERIERIDVVKGSDVLMHGPQTVGAVINLHTWQPTEKPAWLLKGTLGTRKFGEGLVRYSDTSDDVGYVVQAFHKGGAGYRGMGYRVTDAMAKVRFFTSRDGELTAKIAFDDQLAETTYTGLTDALYRKDPRRDTIAPDDHFGIRRYEASLHHRQHLGRAGELRTMVFAYHMDLGLRLQDFDRSRLPVDYARIADPSGLFFRHTSALRDRRYDVAGVSSELEQRFATGQVVHDVTVGARFIDDTARRKLSRGAFSTAESGDLLTDDSTQIFGLAGWLQDQIAMSDIVVLTPAFRVEHSRSEKTTHRIDDGTQAPHDVDLSGTSHSTGLMPGLGLAIGTTRFNVFSSLYLGYSAPRVTQSIAPDGRDADLNAEHSSNYEAGLRGRVGHWLRAEADAFLVNFDNQLVSNNPLSGSTSEFINGGRTRHVGVESTATLRAGRALALPVFVDLGAHYTFVRSRFVGGTFAGNTIPYSPVNTASGTLDVGHRASGLSGQVAMTYVGGQFTDEKNTVAPGPTGLDGRIDPYTVVGLAARYRHKPTGLSLSVTVKNALDRVYISNRLPNGIFTAGFRQVYVSLAWSSPD